MSRTPEEAQEQFDIADRLKVKWLRRMEAMLDDESISSTDMATLGRLLSQNGWTLDRARIPSRLKDKLTANFDPSTPDADDKVVPIRAAGGKG